MEVLAMTRRKNINWSELVIKQEASGKTVPDFCVDEGIHPNTFYINDSPEKR